MGTRSPLGQFHVIFIANNSKRFKETEKRATQESFHALLRAQDKLTKIKAEKLPNTNTSKKMFGQLLGAHSSLSVFLKISSSFRENF